MKKRKAQIAYIGVVLTVFMICACKPAHVADSKLKNVLSGQLNAEVLYGTLSFSEAGTKIKLEDYALTLRNGKGKTFNTCADVSEQPEADISPNSYFFYKRFSIECYGAQKFLEGQPSKDSFVDVPLIELLPEFPSIISPQIGESEIYDVRRGKKLIEVFPEIKLVEHSNISLSTTFDGLEIDYEVLGQKDINGDGHEDVLLLMTYHIIEASGRGTQLFALSKTSQTAPITVLWTYR